MDKEAESLSTKASSVQCKRRDARYLAMSYVCNLFALRLEDVLDKSGRRILNAKLELDLSLLQNDVYRVRSSLTKYTYMNLESIKSPEQWQKVESESRWLYGGGCVVPNRIWQLNQIRLSSRIRFSIVPDVLMYW